jgi:hypothetical protein
MSSLATFATPALLNQIWKATKITCANNGNRTTTGRTPRLLCADGFSVSVQVGDCSYSAPRNDDGPWYEAELGFPSEAEGTWLEWCESPDAPTETVYGYVPLHAICDVLNKHGGIIGATLPGLREPV